MKTSFFPNNPKRQHRDHGPFEGRFPVPYKKGKFSNATYNCEIRRRSDPASREAKFILKRTPGTCVLKKSSCFQLLFNSIR